MAMGALVLVRANGLRCTNNRMKVDVNHKTGLGMDRMSSLTGVQVQAQALVPAQAQDHMQLTTNGLRTPTCYLLLRLQLIRPSIPMPLHTPISPLLPPPLPMLLNGICRTWRCYSNPNITPVHMNRMQTALPTATATPGCIPHHPPYPIPLSPPYQQPTTLLLLLPHLFPVGTIRVLGPPPPPPPLLLPLPPPPPRRRCRHFPSCLRFPSIPRLCLLPHHPHMPLPLSTFPLKQVQAQGAFRDLLLCGSAECAIPALPPKIQTSIPSCARSIQCGTVL
mmetsp:Transcript_34432/g.55706  ORF Transcript_34432/g.55706 Transcript_34432/m.55706 type:complete len:278 (+) Transcript_34432:1736-2569(+)